MSRKIKGTYEKVYLKMNERNMENNQIKKKQIDRA